MARITYHYYIIGRSGAPYSIFIGTKISEQREKSSDLVRIVPPF